MHKQLARYMKSLADLKEAGEFLSLYSSSQDELVKNAAEIAFIISYSRPFSGNKETVEGVPNKLRTKRINFTLEERELHTKITEAFRNKLIAHSELSYLQPEVEVFNGGRSTRFSHKRTNRLLTTINLSTAEALIKKMTAFTESLAKEASLKIADGTHKICSE